MKARQASKRFIEDLKNGKIKRDILPQGGDPEVDMGEDLKRYETFLNSDFGKRMVNI